MSTRIRGYGLENLIKGQVPTFTGWDTDPTDAANIVDGDASMICTTGVVSAGAAWQAAYLTWDFGAIYSFITSGFGRIETTVGSGFIYLQVYDGAIWRPARTYCMGGNGDYGACDAYSGIGSAIRLEFMNDTACDYSPYISMFNVWKMW